MKPFRNRKTIRLQSWDYRWAGAYFVTIITKNRIHHFGEITLGKMNLNTSGRTAHQYWVEIPEHFPHVRLGNFVVMPNHVHGVLLLDAPNLNDDEEIPDNKKDGYSADPIKARMSAISPKSRSLSAIIRSYKSIVSKQIHVYDPSFHWHYRFHDHIIRDEEEFHLIQNYIRMNPENWKEDRFFERK